MKLLLLALTLKIETFPFDFPVLLSQWFSTLRFRLSADKMVFDFQTFDLTLFKKKISVLTEKEKSSFVKFLSVWLDKKKIFKNSQENNAYLYLQLAAFFLNPL